MLLLRSVRSRLLLDHRAIAHSLQRCSKYEKIIVERLGRSENGNFITRKHMFHFTLTLIFDRPFSHVSRSLVFAKLFKLQLYSILHVNPNLNLNKLCGIQIINQNAISQNYSSVARRSIYEAGFSIYQTLPLTLPLFPLFGKSSLRLETFPKFNTFRIKKEVEG